MDKYLRISIMLNSPYTSKMKISNTKLGFRLSGIEY